MSETTEKTFALIQNVAGTVTLQQLIGDAEPYLGPGSKIIEQGRKFVVISAFVPQSTEPGFAEKSAWMRDGFKDLDEGRTPKPWTSVDEAAISTLSGTGDQILTADELTSFTDLLDGNADDMEAMGPVRLHETEKAQVVILLKVTEMVADGRFEFETEDETDADASHASPVETEKTWYLVETKHVNMTVSPRQGIGTKVLASGPAKALVDYLEGLGWDRGTATLFVANRIADLEDDLHLILGERSGTNYLARTRNGDFFGKQMGIRFSGDAGQVIDYLREFDDPISPVTDQTWVVEKVHNKNFLKAKDPVLDLGPAPSEDVDQEPVETTRPHPFSEDVDQDSLPYRAASWLRNNPRRVIGTLMLLIAAILIWQFWPFGHDSDVQIDQPAPVAEDVVTEPAPEPVSPAPEAEDGWVPIGETEVVDVVSDPAHQPEIVAEPQTEPAPEADEDVDASEPAVVTGPNGQVMLPIVPHVELPPELQACNERVMIPPRRNEMTGLTVFRYACPQGGFIECQAGPSGVCFTDIDAEKKARLAFSQERWTHQQGLPQAPQIAELPEEDLEEIEPEAAAEAAADGEVVTLSIDGEDEGTVTVE